MSAASRSPRRRPLSHRGVTISRFAHVTPPSNDDDDVDDAALENLTDAIEDANVNLKNIDGLVKDYSQIHVIQSQTIHRLKSDLEKNHEQLREEKLARHRRRLAELSASAETNHFYASNGNASQFETPRQTARPQLLPNGLATYNTPSVPYQDPTLPQPSTLGGHSAHSAHPVYDRLPNGTYHPPLASQKLEGDDPQRPAFENWRRPANDEADVGRLLETAKRREEVKWTTANAFVTPSKHSFDAKDDEGGVRHTLDKRLCEIEKTLKASKTVAMPSKSFHGVGDASTSKTNTPRMNGTLRKSESLFSVGVSENGASGALNGISAELRRALEREDEEEEERTMREVSRRSRRSPAGNVDGTSSIAKIPAVPSLAADLRAKDEEILELRTTNETLRREMDQIQGGEGFYVKRIEDLEASVGKLEKEKEEARKALTEWSERGGEEEAKRKRERIILEDERRRWKDEKERLETLLSDACRRGVDADGLRLQVEELASAVEARDARLRRLEEELREKETAILETRHRCHEAQAAETTAKEDTDEAIRIADDMRNSITRLEEEKAESEAEAKESKEKIKGLVEKYEEMKGKAHEAIRQWKAKVKKMELEAKLTSETATQLREANERLVVEVETVSAQKLTAIERGEKLLNEVECFGEIKGRLEEQLRLTEIQCEESRSEILEKAAALVELKEIHEAVEAEAIELRAKSREGKEERRLMEERLKEMAMEMRVMERDKAVAERNVEETTRERESLAEEAAVKDVEIQALRRAKMDAEKRSRLAEERIDRETEQFKETIASLEEELRKVNASASSREDSSSTRHRELQTRVENLKLNVAEKDAAVANCNETIEALTCELNKLKRDYDDLGEEYDKSTTTVKGLKERLDKREELAKDFDRRLRTLTVAHEDLRETMRRKEKETLQLFRGVDADLDETVILASRCSAVEFTSSAMTSSASVTPSASNGEALLNALKPKLKWVATVVAKMGKELSEAKSELASARHRVDSLQASLKEEKDKRSRIDAAHVSTVKSMEEKFCRLSSFVESHAERDIQHVQTLQSTQNGGNDRFGLSMGSGDGPATPLATSRRPTSERSEISPRSKDEIERRYRGYRETVDNLQRDLIEVANATPRVVYTRTPSPTIMRGASGMGYVPWTSTPGKDPS